VVEAAVVAAATAAAAVAVAVIDPSSQGSTPTLIGLIPQGRGAIPLLESH
jgi:hypothetical protein